MSLPGEPEIPDDPSSAEAEELSLRDAVPEYARGLVEILNGRACVTGHMRDEGHEWHCIVATGSGPHLLSFAMVAFDEQGVQTLYSFAHKDAKRSVMMRTTEVDGKITEQITLDEQGRAALLSGITPSVFEEGELDEHVLALPNFRVILKHLPASARPKRSADRKALDYGPNTKGVVEVLGDKECAAGSVLIDTTFVPCTVSRKPGNAIKLKSGGGLLPESGAKDLEVILRSGQDPDGRANIAQLGPFGIQGGLRPQHVATILRSVRSETFFEGHVVSLPKLFAGGVCLVEADVTLGDYSFAFEGHRDAHNGLLVLTFRPSAHNVERLLSFDLVLQNDGTFVWGESRTAVIGYECFADWRRELFSDKTSGTFLESLGVGNFRLRTRATAISDPEPVQISDDDFDYLSRIPSQAPILVQLPGAPGLHRVGLSEGTRNVMVLGSQTPVDGVAKDFVFCFDGDGVLQQGQLGLRTGVEGPDLDLDGILAAPMMGPGHRRSVWGQVWAGVQKWKKGGSSPAE